MVMMRQCSFTVGKRKEMDHLVNDVDNGGGMHV